MTSLLKHFVLAMLTVSAVLCFVDVVFANPIPMEPLGSSGPMQYLAIIVAEACGLLAGTAILIKGSQTYWRKTAVIMASALIVSYTIGMIVWASGYIMGILIYNPNSPFFSFSDPLGIVFLLLPEFIGTVIGAVLIHLNLKVSWKMAFFAMAVAMLASFLVGLLIANIFLITY